MPRTTDLLDDNSLLNVMDEPVEIAITDRFVKAAHELIGPGRRWEIKKAFCADMGMHYQELHMLETRQRKIQFRYLVRFHELTKADMNYLILGKKIKPSNSRAITMLNRVIEELK